jgi:cardiolipin synthase
LAGLVVLAGAAPLLHRLADALRASPIERVLVGTALPDPQTGAFAELVGALSEITPLSAEGLEILPDDAVYTRLFADLAGAERSITLFSYFCRPGRLAERLTETLVDAARRGVDVRFLGDGYGCRSYVDRLREPLAAAGGQAAVLRPIRWYTLHRAQHRNHGRSIVIDGRIGYTGGFGIADRWLGENGGAPWREASARLTGSVVQALQVAFLTSWTEATGTLPADAELSAAPRGEGRPPPEGEGPDTEERDGVFAGVSAGLLLSRPGLGPTEAQRFLALTISGARETLYVANAYFVPSPALRNLLLGAVARGVDVRVLVPGPRNDHPTTKWAGQLYFDELLAGGVRIYEYGPSMLHAKTLVVDGVWSTLGSLNLDPRSLRINEEWSLVIHDPAVGATMDSIFFADLEHAREVTLAAHRARPFRHRLRELAVSLLVPLL